MEKTDKNIKIAVVGLGYVGLPLGIEFSKKYPTVGFDLNEERINQLKNGIDKTLEVSNDELENTSILFTTDTKNLADCNVYIITVPTPVDKYNNPDMKPLSSASKTVGKVLRNSDVVIYESTVYPGATEEFCIPILEKESDLTYNVDFFCGYSPERINPGDKEHNIKTITKVTAGSNEEIADLVNTLYQSIVPAGTHKASSIAVAEAAKVIENIQRDVNIALINELSMIFDKLDIDTTEVLEAAGTKWNFLPFRPGLVGGHCIGVDPYYMTHKAQEIGYNPEMILAGRRINDTMGKYIANITINEIVKAGVNPLGAKVAILGITFKENCPDLRNTKVSDIINHLHTYGCETKVTDPFADINEARDKFKIDLLDLDKISKSDVVIIAVAHDEYKEITKEEYHARGKDESGGSMGGRVADSMVEGSKSIPAKDAVTQQKTVDEEVEEEVTTTEVVLEDGKYVQKTTTKTVTKTVKVPQYNEVDLYDKDGEVIGKHQVPIMETVEEAVDAVDAVAETYFREHKYHSDRIPEGVTAPDDAEVIEIVKQRQKINPDFDESVEYESREDRDEWHIVGLLGQIPITKGQPVADNWTKMKDVSDTVEMYFVK